jgi:Protein of unknown function (DUF3306)
MSELDDVPGNFLRRWSRRKRAAEAQVREAGQSPESARAKTSAPSRSFEPDTTRSPAFDPTSLPPIESITAASDVQAFLAPGVPVELSRAALRRVWMTDPVIRDFVGLAENQWDFTKPETVPGFGALELTPQLRRIIAELVADPGVAASGPDPDSQDVVQEAQKCEAAWPLMTDQTAEVDTHRVAAPGAAEKLAAGLEAPIVRGNIGTAVQRDTEQACDDRAHAPRRHGGALPT